MSLLPPAEDIVKVELLYKPDEIAKGEGLFEWRHLKTRVTMDVLDLLKEFETIFPGRSDSMMDRLYNMQKLYINLKTKEVSS